MDNINTGGLDWMVNETEKDSHQFSEKGKALKRKPLTRTEICYLQIKTETPKHITSVRERHLESPLEL